MASVKRLEFDNRLKEQRQAAGLSQKQLAVMAGITRQAVAAVETGQYSPATSVALQLARALDCRVEDLFSLKTEGEIVEGELLGVMPKGNRQVRAQISQVSGRLLVRPLEGLGELTSLTACADGLILGADLRKKSVKVKLLKEREVISRQAAIGGCDPAMFLAADHLRLHGRNHLAPHLMGNSLALAALKRGEVHVAGVHLADGHRGDAKSAYLKRALGGLDCTVITFAHWEQGLIVRPGNPKQIHGASDLGHPKVKIINREKGSGARLLIDRELRSAGLPTAKLKGYGDEVLSHFEVAARIKAGLVDAGVGVRSAAAICGLDFIPLQRERYDLVIPRAHYQSLAAVRNFLDLIVGKAFRTELEALGGYDTRETGKIVDLHR